MKNEKRNPNGKEKGYDFFKGLFVFFSLGHFSLLFATF